LIAKHVANYLLRLHTFERKHFNDFIYMVLRNLHNREGYWQVREIADTVPTLRTGQ